MTKASHNCDVNSHFKVLDSIDFITIAVLIASYAVWMSATTWLADFSLPVSMVLITFSAVLHSSLCHEALHGHPTPYAIVNEALVFPALSVFIPYKRFRDTHLTHHIDEQLTDPFDDPETNFQDPKVWSEKPKWLKVLHEFNNTLCGRLVIGPAMGQVLWMYSEFHLVWTGKDPNNVILLSWLWHIPALAPVLWWVYSVGRVPWWAFWLSSYCCISVLKIRSFLEHRAHDLVRCRTVVVEDNGLLSFLFLNNNLHAVHHKHPGVSWFRLPALYRSLKEKYLTDNGGYVYSSYAEIFRKYFWNAKDPVPHPLRTK